MRRSLIVEIHGFLPGLGVCVSVGSRGIEVEILANFGASAGLVEVFVGFFKL